ncbi:hypothetical protein WJX73_007437 [Symbiochloris irregularis]|uniref:VPS10 domain-containing protein n=1 Tax=Symbiochloris irregularis TaxID=706552 RepID=A0AAW1PE90_9CHLO
MCLYLRKIFEKASAGSEYKSNIVGRSATAPDSNEIKMARNLPEQLFEIVLVIACVASSSLVAPALAQNETCQPKAYPQTGDLPKAVTFGTTIEELHWMGFESEADKYVFAITAAIDFDGGGEVWRSDNFGAADSWKNVSADLEGFYNSTFLTGVYQLHHFWKNPERILLQGAGTSNWVSVDFGERWQRVDTPGSTIGFWTQIKLHSTQPEWMLALVRRNTCFRPQSAALDKWCNTDLFVSQDFGRSWSNLTDNSQGRIAAFVDFDWGSDLYRWGEANDTIRDETIFATAYEDPKHIKGPLPNWDKNVHYVVSHDFFKTSHEKVVSCGNQFDIINGQVYLAVPNNCPEGPNGEKKKLNSAQQISATVGMYVSDSMGMNFREACLPSGDLDLGYHMWQTPFNGTYLVTRHSEDSLAAANAPVSTVYSSGKLRGAALGLSIHRLPFGAMPVRHACHAGPVVKNHGGSAGVFSTSLGNVYRRGKHPDFVSLDGAPGMFIANSLGFQALASAAFHYSTDPTDYEKYVQTRVSYNGGAHWNLLNKPSQFNHPQCDLCTHQAGAGRYGNYTCQLHLHGPSSWASGEGKLPGLHTHWTAPGLVMAVGSVGEYLSFARDYTCTYLSRDGGETWTDIDTRATVFEFGDQGGILIKASHQSEESTDTVEFSLDQGSCWHSVKLSEAIDVIGIRVEPTAASHIFLVHGEACFKDDDHPNCTHTDVGTRPPGKLFSLDLQHIVGNEWKTCGDDAYEQFSYPTPDRCLMGRNLTAERRKADAACFNGRDWSPKGWDTPCNCSMIDTQCDYGYNLHYRNGSWVCLPEPGFNPQACPLIHDHTYTVSETGLRLLGGDSCANVSLVIPDTDGRGRSNHPFRHGFPRWATVTLLLLGTVAVIAVLAVYMKGRADNSSGDSYSSGGGGMMGVVAGGIEWVRSKLPGGRNRQDQSYFQPLSGGEE